MRAEAVRDRGGHCLVVVDDIAPLAELWDTLAITGLSGLGLEVVSQHQGSTQGHTRAAPGATPEAIRGRTRGQA